MGKLQEIYSKIDERDRRQLPPPKDPFDIVTEQLDRATHGLRKWASNRIRQVINDLDNAQRSGTLSERYTEAASQLHGLRQRVLTPGMGNLVAAGNAVIQCVKLKTLAL